MPPNDHSPSPPPPPLPLEKTEFLGLPAKLPPDETDDFLQELAELQIPLDRRMTAAFCVSPSVADAEATTAAENLTLPIQVDRFQLLDELARGGMGVIYRGHDPRFRRQLAVKALLPVHAAKDEFHRRFVNEARITARLEHPGIVPIYDMGTLPDGRPYFTMRVVQGMTLAEMICHHNDPSYSRPRLLKVFDQVCLALAYAHAHGIIHRDLKPSNVIVGPFGVTKVLDWGVAKVMPGSPIADDEWFDQDHFPELVFEELATPITRAGLIVGTLAYMAPEQAQGQIDRVSYWSDVFGLGALLCDILTGQPPYVAQTNRRTLLKAIKADLADAHARLDACGAERTLIDLAKSCLAVTPEDRPHDAGELAQRYTAYLESDLRRAERDWVRFFELSWDLFCIASLDGYFRRVNENFTRVLGYDSCDLLSQPFLNFVHPDDIERTLGAMAVLSEGNPVVRFRNRYRDIHGSYRWFEWTAKSVLEESTIYAVARDVTERDDFNPHTSGV